MKAISLLATTLIASSVGAVTYPVVDTGQIRTYNDNNEIPFPSTTKDFSGQDAQFSTNPPSYRNNHDGTVSDLVTGLMWTQDPGEKMTLKNAIRNASKCRTGGYSDWRLPTIKELYSLIQLNGTDPDPQSRDTSSLTPFIDTNYFKFQYGREEKDERIIDSQYASSTEYVSTTMNNDRTLFGVNFADGRIKGYPIENRRGEKTFYVIYVRNNPAYGKNDFVDNRDGTITDRATGLTWTKADSKRGLDWSDALAYANNLKLGGHSDWRLPNAKELQSIIDYTRSPDTTRSAAIDPIFDATQIKNEGGKPDYAQYWTSTTHLSTRGAKTAVYFAFGRSLGFMKDRRTGKTTLMDVHGAGSQRSDPKAGDASKYPTGRGPQGDVIRIENMVRCVRGGDAEPVASGPAPEKNSAQFSRKSSRPQSSSSNAAPASAFMDREDKNGDGKVSKSEFRGPSAHFSRLDKNGDGYISADEAPTKKPNRS